jgi:tetratricopeptide (TPR) repeat protein
LARLFLSRNAEAKEDFDHALRLEPENATFIQHRASLAMQEGDTKIAIDLMRQAPPSANHPEAPLILAELFAETGQYDDAEGALERIPPDAPDITSQQAMRVRMRIMVQRKDWPGAKKLYAIMAEAYPESLEIMTDGAWLARLSGDEAEGNALLEAATRQLTPDGSPAQVHALAAEWYERQDFKEAVRLYRRIADRDADSPLTRRLVVCLYYAGERDEALLLAQHMLSLHGPLPTISEVAAAILDGIGDLPGAKLVAESYLGRFPDDLGMQLHRATLLQRTGDTESLDAFLDSLSVPARMPLEEALRAASLYAARGRTAQALHLAYETRREHYKDSRAHLSYVSLVLGAEKHDPLEEGMSAALVGLDMAVCIRDDDGHEQWHVIEERTYSHAPLELAATHPLAQKLIGHPVGATVVIKESDFSTERAYIKTVQSKYVYAVQETMRAFERMFPDTPGLWKIRLPMVVDGDQEPEPDLDPFFEQITHHHEHGLAMERLYQEGKITLGMLARLTGDNILATLSRAVSKPDVGVRCCHGAAGELAAAKQLLHSEAIVVLDPISLLTLHNLEARDALTARFGKFSVAQSTIDMLQQLRQECQGAKSSGYMTVGKQGRQFVRQDVTADDIQQNITYIEGLLAWIQEHCVISPVLAALASNTDHLKQLREMMSPCFVDSILLGSEAGKILYSDDGTLRSLAKAELGYDGVWTQALLERALDEGVIDETVYSADVIRLSGLNYNVTYVKANMLTWAARKSDWKPTYPFTAAARVLSYTKSDVLWALAAATETIYEIWREPLMDHGRSLLLTEVLNSLCLGRDRATVLEGLTQRLQPRFYLLPIQLRQVVTLINLWASTHLL